MKNIYQSLSLLRASACALVFAAALVPKLHSQSYCTPSYGTGCTSGDDINNFILGAGGSLINHIGSGCSANGYGNFTASFNPVLQAGLTYPFSTTHNFSSQGLAIWIDFNNNFIFEAAEAVFQSASTGNAHSGNITIPGMVPSGQYRMRVRCMYAYNGTQIDPCISQSSWGEAHDYTITVTNAPCVAPVNGGTATASVSNTCAASPFVLSATGMSMGSGIQYQWQSSTNGFTWTNVVGATSASSSITQSVAQSYRLRTICVNGPDTAYSNVVNVGMNPFMSCYCPNGANNTGDTDISRVVLGGMDNYAAPTCQTYTDYSSSLPAIPLLAGISYPVSVELDDCSPSFYYSAGVAVFIDFNQNGYFGDPGEKVMANNNQSVPYTASGSFTVPLSAIPGNTKMRVIAAEGYNGSDITDGCFVYGYGETEDYMVTIIPQSPNEVAMVSIDEPELTACSFGNSILATIKNNGTDTLTSVTFTVNTGGIISNSVWTGSIPPAVAQQVTVPGVYSFNDGDTISLEVSLPNGVADAYSGDNFKGRRTHLALQGVYKVGYGVNNADSIADISTVIQRIHQKGVCDTVYFDIKPGTYTGRYTINDYIGWAPGKQAIFRSETGNRSDVILVDSATSAATNYIFNLDGGDGIGFESLTLRARGATYRTIFNIKNGAHYLYVNDCDLLADTTTAGGAGTGNFDHLIFRSADGTKDDHTVITNNFIRGGGRAIDLGSATGTYEEGHIIRNNIIKNPYAWGIILGSQDNPIVENNVITLAPYANITPSYGLYLATSINGGSLAGNDIKTYSNGYAMYLTNVKGSSSSLLVANNFLYNGDSTVVSGSYGLYIGDVNTNNVLVANNSIKTKTASANAGSLSVLDGSGIRLFNNNIGSYNSGPAIKIDKSYSVLESNNNNFFNEDGNPIGSYSGMSAYNIADWKSATGKDANSMSVHPGFSGEDLHTCQLALEGAAMPLAEITLDIDGDVRNAAADIGADEFLGSAVGLLDEDEIEKCPNVSVSLGNPATSGVTYSWSSGENTSEINTSNAGQYIITATSACGSFSDTVTVINKPNPTAGFNVDATNGLSVVLNNTSTNASGYLWDFGDGTNSTEENPTHMYSSSGQYVITLTVYGECDTITITNAVSVYNVGNEEFITGSVEMYPNPATENVNLVFKGVNVGDAQIKLIDLSGKVILIKQVPVGDGSVVTLDLNSISMGVYTVSIDINGEVKVLKLVRK